jgi:hypothetical protein
VVCLRETTSHLTRYSFSVFVNPDHGYSYRRCIPSVVPRSSTSSFLGSTTPGANRHPLSRTFNFLMFSSSKSVPTKSAVSPDADNQVEVIVILCPCRSLTIVLPGVHMVFVVANFNACLASPETCRKDMCSGERTCCLVGPMCPTRDSGDQTFERLQNQHQTRPCFPSHFISLWQALKSRKF